MDVDYGPYMVGPINFRTTKIKHFLAPTNFRAALRENEWCAKFEVITVNLISNYSMNKIPLYWVLEKSLQFFVAKAVM